MLQLECQAAGVAVTASDLGTVLPGATSPAYLFSVVNTGDTDIVAPLAWIEQLNPDDGALTVTIANLVVLGTSRETATVLPALAVGVSHAASASFTTPSGAIGLPVDTATLRVEPL